MSSSPLVTLSVRGSIAGEILSTVQVSAADDVESLRRKLLSQLNLQFGTIQLFFGQRPLHRNERLLNCGVQDGCIIDVVRLQTQLFARDYSSAAVWDLATGSRRLSLIDSLEPFVGVHSAAFAPDGLIVATGHADGTIKLWNLDSGLCELSLQVHDDIVLSMAFSLGGNSLAIGCEDGTAKILAMNAENMECTMVLRGHLDEVIGTEFAPGGHSLMTQSNSIINVWNLQSGESTRVLQPLAPHGFLAAKYSSDGRSLMTGREDGVAELWSIESGEVVKAFNGHEGPIGSIAFAPNELLVLTGCQDGSARLWSIETGECTRIFNHGPPVACVTSANFTPDGKAVVTGCHSGEAKIWSIESGECIMTYPLQNGLFHILLRP